MAAAYICIGLALVGIVAMAGWGVYHDLELVRTTFCNRRLIACDRMSFGVSARFRSKCRVTEGPNKLLSVLSSPKNCRSISGTLVASRLPERNQANTRRLSNAREDHLSQPHGS